MTDANSLMQFFNQMNAAQNPTVNGMQPTAGVATGRMIQPDGTMGTAGAVPAGTTGGSGAMGAGTGMMLTGIVDGISQMLAGQAKAKAIPDPVQSVPTPPPTAAAPLMSFQLPQTLEPKPLTRPPGAL